MLIIDFVGLVRRFRSLIEGPTKRPDAYLFPVKERQRVILKALHLWRDG